MWVRDVAAHGRGRDVTHFHLQLLSRVVGDDVVDGVMLDDVLARIVALHGSLVHLGPVQRHSEPAQVQVVRVVVRLLLAVAVARAATAAVVDLRRLPLRVFLVLHPPVLEPYLHLSLGQVQISGQLPPLLLRDVRVV